MAKTSILMEMALRMEKDMTTRVKGNQATDQTGVAQVTAAIPTLAHIQEATRSVIPKRGN